MGTMKAAVLYGDRDLRIVDIPKPQAPDNGVLVKVAGVGVCGTDLHTYKLGMFREMSLPQKDGSILFGHEFAGEVVAIGENAQVGSIGVGDRVVGIALGAYAEYCQVMPMIGDTPLLAKLPDVLDAAQKANKVKNLLQGMRRAGLVHPRGPRSLAVWHLGPGD